MSQHSLFHEDSSTELELIEFYIEEAQEDGEIYRGYYGMNVAKVLEIIREPKVTSVPSKHHPAALGTFNLRGRVLPLVDLSVWLGKDLAPSDALKVIVCEYSGVITAFLVSGVTRIHRMSWQQVEPPSPYVHTYSHHSVTGIVRIEDRILFILDMEKLINTLNPGLSMNRLNEVQTKEQASSDNPEEQNIATGKAMIAQATLSVKDAGRFHILVADDSHSILTAIVQTLESAGYRVSKTHSGKGAWQMLSKWKAEADASKKPIHDFVDLVISDIEMPEMDGHALTKHIKADAVLRQIPVVLFSSLITDAMRIKGEKVGANAQISKPDLPSLTVRVREVIAQAHGK